MEQVRRSTRPRMMKKKSDIHYFDEQKIELNEDERDLLYPNERQLEKRYCFCKRTEQEALGLTMIECDSCHDWFHDICIGISPEEMEQLEIYYCPSCSYKPVKYMKRSQPSVADIELLLTALAEIDEEKPRIKKKESRLSLPRVSLYHFYEALDINNYAGVVGYLKNESSSTIEENKMVVPVTKEDLQKGILWTSWGNYKIATASDGRLQASTYHCYKNQNIEKNENPVNYSTITSENLNGNFVIKINEMEPIEIPVKDFELKFCQEKAEKVLEAVKCVNLEKAKEFFNANCRFKPVGFIKATGN